MEGGHARQIRRKRAQTTRSPPPNPSKNDQDTIWERFGENQKFRFFPVFSSSRGLDLPEKCPTGPPAPSNEPQIGRKRAQTTRFPPPNTSQNHQDTIWERFGENKKFRFFSVFPTSRAPAPPSRACREMPKRTPGTAQMNALLRAEQPKQRVSHLQTPPTIIGI